MRRREHDPRIHERARTAIYITVSIVLAIVWYLAMVPRDEGFAPMPISLAVLGLLAGATIAVAWNLWLFLPLLSWRITVAVGMLAPFVGAALLALAVGGATWITWGVLGGAFPPASRAFVDFPLRALRFAGERAFVVVPLGIASVLVLRTVLVVGRRKGDVQTHARGSLRAP